MRCQIFSLIVAFFTLTAEAHQVNESSSRAFREDRDGWIFVHVEGRPEIRGYDYGVLLAPEIDDFISTLKVYLLQTSNQTWQFYRDAAQKLFLPKLDQEYLLEIAGIAEGLREAGYDYDEIDIIAQNGYIELSEYYLPTLGGSQKKAKSPKLRCSAFIATGDWTKDGKIVMGHNSWEDYILGQRTRVVLDLLPSSGNRILMQTAPGFIHSSTDFAVNSAGIVITETTIGNFKGFDTNGLPEFMRARKAAQYSNSIDDFVTIMRTGNNGGYANAWLIGDIRTQEIGKLELGLINVAFYRSSNGYYDGENYVDDSKMIRDEVGPTLWQTLSDWPFNLSEANTVDARRSRWFALMNENKGLIDANLAKAFLADQIEQSTGKFAPGGFVLMSRMEVTDRPEMPGGTAPRPFGANEGKVITTDLARNMSFWARMGHPDGSTFEWAPFINEHPAFEWQKPYLQDLENNPWSLFSANATRH